MADPNVYDATRAAVAGSGIQVGDAPPRTKKERTGLHLWTNSLAARGEGGVPRVQSLHYQGAYIGPLVQSDSHGLWFNNLSYGTGKGYRTLAGAAFATVALYVEHEL